MPAIKLPVTEAYFIANWASTTLGNATPFQINAIQQLLNAKKNYRQADSFAGANESNLTTIFADGLS